MAQILNETETSSGSTVTNEQQDSARTEQYLKKRNLVLDFLHSDLNPRHLQYHWKKLNLLKKCYFYLKIEPRHVCVVEQNNTMISTDILQVADLYQLERIKKAGENQTEIQLALLSELLEQLEQGRKELAHYIENCDMATLLSQWDSTMKKMVKISMLLNKLPSVEEPRQLYVKHSLVSQMVLGGAAHPHISFSLYVKKPPIFDRRQCFTSKNRAQLQWFTGSQESRLERWHVEVNLVTDDSQTEPGYSQAQEVLSNPCVIHDLEPGREYEFTVRRCVTPLLVYSQWYDSIVLKTKPGPAGGTTISWMREITRPTS